MPLRHGKQESPSSRPLSQAPVIAVDARLLQPRDCDRQVHRGVVSDGVDGIVRVAQPVTADVTGNSPDRLSPTDGRERPKRTSADCSIRDGGATSPVVA